MQSPNHVHLAIALALWIIRRQDSKSEERKMTHVVVVSHAVAHASALASVAAVSA
jgi:hypothetical protein